MDGPGILNRFVHADEERGILLSTISTSHAATTGSADTRRMNGIPADVAALANAERLRASNVNAPLGQPSSPNNRGSDTVPDGYPALAAYIAGDADDEGFVFRRFRWLTARNLLHLQNGLIDLQRRLQEIDNRRNVTSAFARRNWSAFRSDQASSKLMNDIDEKLRHYRK